MNPLTNMKNVKKLGEQELQRSHKTSWHDQYRASAWIFIGGLPYDLTEGDIIAVFSQYGEIVNINLIRDKDTGKSKGFCFLCYEDQRSTDLAVDNFNGVKILGRIIRVDHVNNYKVPKDGKKTDEVTKLLYKEGCAPKPQAPSLPPPTIKPFQLKPQDLRETLSDQVSSDIKLPMRLPIYIVKDEVGSTITTVTEAAEDTTDVIEKKRKKHKKDKKHKKKKSHKKKKDISDSSGSDSSDNEHKQNEKKQRTHDDRYGNYKEDKYKDYREDRNNDYRKHQ